MCNDATKLPNPIVVSGSTRFRTDASSVCGQARDRASPTTIIYTAPRHPAPASRTYCSGKDLGGAPGRLLLFLDATTIDFAVHVRGRTEGRRRRLGGCFTKLRRTFRSRGQRTSSTSLDPYRRRSSSCRLQPRTRYLTYAEARSSMVAASPPRTQSADSPIRRRCSAGTRASDNRSWSPRTLACRRRRWRAPSCVDGVVDGLIGALTKLDQRDGRFVVVDKGYASAGSRALAFQSARPDPGLRLDSDTALPDRRNVRDGHCTIWGYEHLIAKASAGASRNGPAANLAGGSMAPTPARPSTHLLVEVARGLIPQCAMQVKRLPTAGG